MLLTRAPVASGRIAPPLLPLDLHVLSLSLAFILSQDQTLRCYLSYFFFFLSKIKATNTVVNFVAFARHIIYNVSPVPWTLTYMDMIELT